MAQTINSFAEEGQERFYQLREVVKLANGRLSYSLYITFFSGRIAIEREKHNMLERTRYGTFGSDCVGGINR